MGFVHPWMFGVGGAAVALPLVVHWLTRPRPVRLPLSTIRFVFQAAHQRRARHRLRDAIILLLRAAAVVLIAAAIARPLRGSKVTTSLPTTGGTRIVLLDCSQSMAAAAASGGMTAFDRARAVAGQHLAYDPGLKCNLLLAGARPRSAFDRPSSNFAAIREELAAAQVRPERLDVGAAVRAAAELFSHAPAGPRELIVISDFQRSNWAAVDFAPLPKDVTIKLESVAPAATPDNVAILRVAAAGRAEQAREARLEVEVANFSPVARPVPVEVTVGGKLYRLDGSCPPHGRTTLTADVLLDQSGWYAGEARLVGVTDALAADNARPFALDVRAAPTFALVTRQPAGPRASSSNYLEFALSPNRSRGGGGAAATAESRAGAAGERVVRIDPSSGFDRETLAPADLVVIDHPGKLSTEWIQWLTGALRRGRPVLYVASEPPDATNLKLLADAAGADLKMPVEFSPPAAGQTRRDLFLQDVNAKVLPFSVFGDDLAAVIGPLRFGGGLSSRRLDGGLADDVIAGYGDRSAALVVTPCGAGTLGVLNLDLGQSNLPSSPGFVPLLGELIDRLAGGKRRDVSAVCGEPLTLYLPPEAGGAAGLTVAAADGKAAVDPGSFSDDASGTLWRWTPTAPGAYQVQRDGKTVFAVAATLSPDEADLTPMDPSLFTGRLAGGRQIQYRSPSLEPSETNDAWAWLAVACAGCLLAETTALKLFRT